MPHRQIRYVAEPDDLALTAVATIEGAVLLCVANQSVEPLDAAERVLLHLVEHSTGPRRSGFDDSFAPSRD
ncbi:LmrA/YxaF family transcription factor [Mycobacterium yunnanensis]|uniref:LmrA/YxaF family transcription factor n=1 Tax=Mycobacterium yunnanensis TaxID=368477 RepID=UPI003556E4E1